MSECIERYMLHRRLEPTTLTGETSNHSPKLGMAYVQIKFQKVSWSKQPDDNEWLSTTSAETQHSTIRTMRNYCGLNNKTISKNVSPFTVTSLTYTRLCHRISIRNLVKSSQTVGISRANEDLAIEINIHDMGQSLPALTVRIASSCPTRALRNRDSKGCSRLSSFSRSILCFSS